MKSLFNSSLPITDIVPAIRKYLSDHNTLIVNAPPGAGKSTALPLLLLDEPWLKGKKILMLEPRRLAARAIASYMAEQLGEPTGHRVGYRIRFERMVSEHTRIEILTEGVLTRIMQNDNVLEEVGMVIFDEFHERSIHADLGLALCREIQQWLRPDLRIMVMSATLDSEHMQSQLHCPVATSEGRIYPVEIRYTGDYDIWSIPEMVAGVVLKALSETSGDILVFLPGKGEIKKCEEILKQKADSELRIFSLYGELSSGRQTQAILPDRQGRRKIVLATSIAETSLTIEGVKVVVDCGYSRINRFDPRSGLSKLETVRSSLDIADQRAGRAGRLSPGICYRMWNKATQHRLEPHRNPEILETDLSGLAMELMRWGVYDASKLFWLNPPPPGTYAQALDLLKQLEATDNGKLTKHGEDIHWLPCHPRIAHMLLKAKEHHSLPLAADLAAILEERDPLANEAGIDINIRIETLRRYRRESMKHKKWTKIEKVSRSYRKLFEVEEDNAGFDPYETGILLAYAYPERIACARPGNNAQFQLSNGKIASAHHSDDLAHEAWLSVAHVDAREGMGKIFMAAPLNPKDLAPMVKQEDVISWDSRKGLLNASRELKLGSIILQRKPLPEPDEKMKIQAICNAIRQEGESLLNFDNEVKQWQNRVLSLRKWRNSENWPDVHTSTLILHNEDWLLPYLKDVQKAEDLRKIKLTEVLSGMLSWEQQQKLEQLAPVKIKVPSGSMIALTYREDASPPILAVRLQEVFGLPETPAINEGKTQVVMHLLSPGYKPVQVTSDLRNFWNHTYFEVKKELKGRYPKHIWPDDPWNTPPTSRARPRK
ncbi:MAG: ATP-dependent helicase HrpB [Cyclobacteriaceae bacterium]|nr:ATP-dependent helicase HrpB [Cyclobacteriaceae bacterium]